MCGTYANLYVFVRQLLWRYEKPLNSITTDNFNPAIPIIKRTRIQILQTLVMLKTLYLLTKKGLLLKLKTILLTKSRQPRGVVQDQKQESMKSRESHSGQQLANPNLLISNTHAAHFAEIKKRKPTQEAPSDIYY